VRAGTVPTGAGDGLRVTSRDGDSHVRTLSVQAHAPTVPPKHLWQMAGMIASCLGRGRPAVRAWRRSLSGYNHYIRVEVSLPLLVPGWIGTCRFPGGARAPKNPPEHAAGRGWRYGQDGTGGGGTVATGLAIVDELKQRDFDVTISITAAPTRCPVWRTWSRSTCEPHFLKTIHADLDGRSWDVVVATYGRIRYIAEARRGKTGQLVTVGGTPVQRRVPGVPNWQSDGYNETDNKLIHRLIETEETVMQMHTAGEYTTTVVRYPYVSGPASVITPECHVIKRAQDDRKRWLMPGSGTARLAEAFLLARAGLLDLREASGGVGVLLCRLLVFAGDHLPLRGFGLPVSSVVGAACRLPCRVAPSAHLVFR